MLADIQNFNICVWTLSQKVLKEKITNVFVGTSEVFQLQNYTQSYGFEVIGLKLV